MMAASPMTNGNMELEGPNSSLYMGAGTSPSVDSGFSGSTAPGGSAPQSPTAEEKIAWEAELAKVEEEIRTLRQTFSAMIRHRQSPSGSPKSSDMLATKLSSVEDEARNSDIENESDSCASD